MRNDRLTEGACEYCADFWDIAEDADILLFNRGAHYIEDTETSEQMYNFTMRLTHLQLRRKQVVFWRNTVPGHGGCEEQTEPMQRTTTVSREERTDSEFNWDQIKFQNDMMLSILRMSILEFHYIDAYSITLDRHDRHIGSGDCLHYCLPGPPDLWLQLFIHGLIVSYDGVAHHQSTLGQTPGRPPETKLDAATGLA